MTNNTPFTPGPWEVKRIDQHCGPKKIVTDWDVVPKKYKGFGDGAITRRIDNEANARLIAAAPEMYDLLKETVEHIDEWNFPIALADRIQRALKKVEGDTKGAQ